jgi:sterol desaturase/sphingolipid hydroxylase (fatty acid hydroxylase superfamily)
MIPEKLILITSLILFGWAAVIITWERISPYRKGLSLVREGFWVDLVWYTIIQSFVLKIVIFDFIIAPLQQHFDWSSLQFVSKWPLALQVLFFLVTHDLYIYLFHRFQHSNKIFWRIHEAHHSGKEVDFLAGSRSHVLEIIINQTIEFAPVILLGASPEVIPIKALIDSMYGMYIHANINVKTGKLKYIFNSPELHLWHHANYREVFHANFATKLSIWDYLFGTLYDPGHKPGNEKENWGLYYDYPRDYFLQHAFSVKRFNEKKLLRFRWFNWYYNLRPAALNLIASLWRKQAGKSGSEKPGCENGTAEQETHHTQKITSCPE